MPAGAALWAAFQSRSAAAKLPPAHCGHMTQANTKAETGLTGYCCQAAWADCYSRV